MVSLPSSGRLSWRANGWARVVLPLAGGPGDQHQSHAATF